MQADPELLQQLHDIHLPPALRLWPLAPGWYAVLGISCIAIMASIVWGWRWYQHGKVKRAALRLLHQYEKHYYQTGNTQQTSAEINELLKRVALAYFPRQQVAQLYGTNWLLFLNQTSRKLDFMPEETALLCCPYQKDSVCDLRQTFQLARMWIQQRGVPCSY